MAARPADLVEGERLLLVSPHMDDGVLSAYALMTAGVPTTVLTVCGGHVAPPGVGRWDALCGYPTSEAAARARRIEDAAAMAGLGLELSYLDLLEEQHVDGRTDHERGVVARAVTEWLARSASPATVALPAGAGRRRVGGARGAVDRWSRRVRAVRRARNLAARLTGRESGPLTNRDHLFVRDVVLGCVPPGTGVALLLYEEVPYGWGGAADGPAGDAARARGARARPLCVPVDRAAKASRVARYASQMTRVRGPRGYLGAPEGLPPVERYWRLIPERAVPARRP